MSEKRWQEKLRQKLTQLSTDNDRLRVSVVGVGHELRGDDAAGLAIVRHLALRVNSPHLQLIEAGSAPENCLGSIIRFRPDLILFIDAADMAAAPGTVRWLEWEDLAITNVSTHSLPLNILVNYLTAELGCQVGLLGIQPADISMRECLSPAVSAAADAAAWTLAHLFPVIEGATVS